MISILKLNFSYCCYSNALNIAISCRGQSIKTYVIKIEVILISIQVTKRNFNDKFLTPYVQACQLTISESKIDNG